MTGADRSSCWARFIVWAGILGTSMETLSRLGRHETYTARSCSCSEYLAKLGRQVGLLLPPRKRQCGHPTRLGAQHQEMAWRASVSMNPPEHVASMLGTDVIWMLALPTWASAEPHPFHAAADDLIAPYDVRHRAPCNLPVRQTTRRTSASWHIHSTTSKTLRQRRL